MVAKYMVLVLSKDIEQVHVSFIKKTLGVKPSTNNCVIYVETG